MTLNLDHTDLRGALAVLRSTHDMLLETQARTDRQVDLLLDGGWHGRAAAAYREGWTVWQRGCDQVLTALATMADLIDAHQHDVTDVDLDVARTFA